MTKAFQASNSKLTENGLFVIVYAHKTTDAWETLVSALLQARFDVKASWPLHTEMTGGMVKIGKAVLASSIFLVCRRRLATAGDGHWDDVRKELREVAKERLDFFWSQGIRGADFFISAIGPALSVFGKYERVTKLTGDEVTVSQFLDEVRSLVTNYALQQDYEDDAGRRPSTPKAVSTSSGNGPMGMPRFPLVKLSSYGKRPRHRHRTHVGSHRCSGKSGRKRPGRTRRQAHENQEPGRA